MMGAPGQVLTYVASAEEAEKEKIEDEKTSRKYEDERKNTNIILGSLNRQAAYASRLTLPAGIA